MYPLRDDFIYSLSLTTRPPLSFAIMYLLIYPSLSTPRRLKSPNRPARPVAAGIDFVTPDGMVVPRALGEAALLGRTAVLVGGLLVGMWSPQI